MTNDASRCRVVVNHEEQYSVWPEHKHLPPGWRDAGVTGSRKDCLAHISTVWSDLRPRSVREFQADPVDGRPPDRAAPV
jgi:MbtH protein